MIGPTCGNRRAGVSMRHRETHRGAGVRHKNRSPDPKCPLSDCMSFIGGAWAPNVIWHLSSGPRRFSDLRAEIPMISAKVLTQRLRELEERGILTRSATGSLPPAVAYALTPLGHDFLPVIHAIIAVGERLRRRLPAV